MNPTPHFIGGQWIAGQGAEFAGTDPSTGQEIWRGRAAGQAETEMAVRAARSAFGKWSMQPLEHRAALLGQLAQAYRTSASPGAGASTSLGTGAASDDLALTICRATGKPKWEAMTEVDAMIAKVAISIEAYH